MSANYIELIGEYYPTKNAYTEGDPTVYDDVVWASAPVPQAELDAIHLADEKTKRILQLSETAYFDIIAGFESNALGSPHGYDSQPEDQLNLVGSVATDSDMPYACREALAAQQIVDMGGTVIGTEPTGLSDVFAYTASISVEGSSQNLIISGASAPTFDDLITQINTDFGVYGSAAIEGGNIIVRSSSMGVNATVAINDVDLFSSLTGYVGLGTPIDGVAALAGPKAYKLHTHAQLIQVINDGKDVKLFVLQKFNTKQAHILACTTPEQVWAITWDSVE